MLRTPSQTTLSGQATLPEATLPKRRKTSCFLASVDGDDAVSGGDVTTPLAGGTAPTPNANTTASRLLSDQRYRELVRKAQATFGPAAGALLRQKRGRGRPKGSKNKPKTTTSESSLKTKKKRGRNKKAKTTTLTELEDELETLLTDY